MSLNGSKGGRKLKIPMLLNHHQNLEVEGTGEQGGGGRKGDGWGAGDGRDKGGKRESNTER